MKRNCFFSLRFIIAFAAMLGLLATIASFTPEIVTASTKMGNSEDCTLQVCPELPPNAFPFPIAIRYKNGQGKGFVVTGRTVPACPAGDFLGGLIIPGIQDAGEVISATVGGATAVRGGPPVNAVVNGVSITIQITLYEGHVYIIIRIRID